GPRQAASGTSGVSPGASRSGCRWPSRLACWFPPVIPHDDIGIFWLTSAACPSYCNRVYLVVNAHDDSGGGAEACRSGQGQQPRKPEAEMQPFRQEPIAVGTDCAVLRIRGEVDLYTAPQLREQMIQLVSSGVRHIIADLRGVDFLDSSGLGVLVASLKRLRTHDGSLMVAAGADRTVRIFQITGLTRVLALHRSVLDAMTTDQHWQAAVTGEGRHAAEWCRKHDLL